MYRARVGTIAIDYGIRRILTPHHTTRSACCSFFVFCEAGGGDATGQ